MDYSFAAVLVILTALVLANLPFLSSRLLGMRLFSSGKPFWAHVCELLLAYTVTGGIAYQLESQIGNVFAQRWEFYAITLCLFFVLAFPGFVWRFLWKHHVS